MKTTIKITLRDDNDREEVEVSFEFGLSEKEEESRFNKLRDILKKSDTVTVSREHFFHQIKDLFQNE